ncbi:MAG: Eco57I restriction-modification methylase domain-containing protein [Solirubrobacterales bacterium]
MSPVKERKHVPDILECLAQLSSDEVPTPPKLANDMLDLLPDEVWRDPDLKWLDPCSKSGVFLREIVKRLLFEGLVEWEPDFKKRREHIFRNMIYGCGITELTGIISRRTVYYSRHAAGEHSVIKFDDDAGNIPFVQAEHDFDSGGRCKICGAPEDLERGEDRENYAYAFIHDAYPTKELEDMKFDVIVGNPPYQIGMEDSAGNKTANITPLYQMFVDRAVALDPHYLLMITPSRWFTGGKGLGEFRTRMIADRRLRTIVDNPKIYDCFPTAKIRGGVNYFLWDREHDGDCEISTRINGKVASTSVRDLREGEGVVIRDNRAASIVHKVKERSTSFLSSVVSPNDPFGQSLKTNYKHSESKPFDGSIPLVFGTKVGYISPSQIERRPEWVDRFKVLLPMASSGDTQVDDAGNIVDVVLGAPIALAPGSACTQTYLVAGTFDTAEETQNYAEYLATKFVRFLVLQRKATQHITPDRFRFVPSLDMSKPWTDAQVNELFELTEEEIEYIDKTIKPRSVNLSLESPIPASHLPGGAKYRESTAA